MRYAVVTATEVTHIRLIEPFSFYSELNYLGWLWVDLMLFIYSTPCTCTAKHDVIQSKRVAMPFLLYVFTINVSGGQTAYPKAPNHVMLPLSVPFFSYTRPNSWLCSYLNSSIPQQSIPFTCHCTYIINFRQYIYIYIYICSTLFLIISIYPCMHACSTCSCVNTPAKLNYHIVIMLLFIIISFFVVTNLIFFVLSGCYIL